MKNVYAICYNTLYIFETKEKAIKYFKECCDYCDPMSCEYSRYANIIVDLQFSNVGKDNVSDMIYKIVNNKTKERKELKEQTYYLNIINNYENI